MSDETLRELRRRSIAGDEEALEAYVEELEALGIHDEEALKLDAAARSDFDEHEGKFLRLEAGSDELWVDTGGRHEPVTLKKPVVVQVVGVHEWEFEYEAGYTIRPNWIVIVPDRVERRYPGFTGGPAVEFTVNGIERRIDGLVTRPAWTVDGPVRNGPDEERRELERRAAAGDEGAADTLDHLLFHMGEQVVPRDARELDRALRRILARVGVSDAYGPLRAACAAGRVFRDVPWVVHSTEQAPGSGVVVFGAVTDVKVTDVSFHGDPSSDVTLAFGRLFHETPRSPVADLSKVWPQVVLPLVGKDSWPPLVAWARSPGLDRVRVPRPVLKEWVASVQYRRPR